MEQVLSVVNKTSDDDIQNTTFHQRQSYPFRICDMPLPDCNTGFVYMVVSLRNNYFIHINHHKSLVNAISKHNSGTVDTFLENTLASLCPYGIAAYICGFDCNVTLQKHAQMSWQNAVDNLRQNGNQDFRQWAMVGINVANEISSQLRLVCMC